ncbi:MAG: hypothetical protein CL910_08760 [Deltaproteobacteria bacterium]|nr:hypothetical protein [Deltaproteobacteria bacterium]
MSCARSALALRRQSAAFPARRLAPVATAWLALVLAACVGPGADDLRAAREARARGDLPAAHQHYGAVLAVAPGHAVATQERDELRRELVGAAKGRARSAAETSPGAPGLRQAVAILEAAQPYDPSGSQLREALANWREALGRIDSENRARATQVRSALAARRPELAASTLAEIRMRDPEFADLAELEAALRRAQGDTLEEALSAALAATDLPAARRAFEQLEQLEPARAAARRAGFEQAELAWLEARSVADRAAGRFFTAVSRIEESPARARAGDLLAGLRREGADHYARQAELRLSRGESARALLEAVKGLELQPGHARLFAAHRDARDLEMAGLQTYLAVPTFAAPSKRPDLGAQFSDALISHLFRVLPYGINIVEREKIDLLVRDQDRGLAELGELLNVDPIVSGNVSLMTIDRQESSQESLARVEVGTRQEPNPAYEIALRAARANLPAPGRTPEPLPPATITAPLHETVRYRKGATTLKGFATVAARIFNTAKASIEYAQEFNARTTASDSWQDGVDGTDIVGDPLQLPTETEITEALRNQLVEQVAAVIEAQFEARHRRYLEDARYRLSRREPERAMEPLARGFLYCVKARVAEDDEHFVALRELISEHTESGFLPDLPGLAEADEMPTEKETP